MKAAHRTLTEALTVTSERDFMVSVLELAQLHGWLCHHAPDTADARKLLRSPRRRGRRSQILVDPGVPDLLLVRPPRVVFIETKSAKGETRLGQRIWAETLGACPGVEYYQFRPGDWERVQELLK